MGAEGGTVRRLCVSRRAALDEATQAAARALVERERTEFLPESPIRFIDRQLSSLADAALKPAYNVRSVDPSAIAEAAAVCADHGAILEINAHCRQSEMCEAGAGESLLRDAERLRVQVAAASSAGASVSVKLRAEVPGVELPELSRSLIDSGADVLHVDAMDSEPVIADIVSVVPSAFVIANNGARDRASAHEYLEYGADAVSIARPSDDPAILKRVRDAVDEWFEERGSDPNDLGVTSDA